MYEDIIRGVKKDSERDRKCENCTHASYILSNYLGKVMCQIKLKHMEESDWCEDWKRF
jgi:hypothetical protein